MRYPFWPERLLSAYRALDSGRKWIFIAEHDQVIDPYCWKHGLHEIINEHGADAHVMLTDFADHQSINEGTVFIRNSPIGRMFLELAIHFIDKIGYSISGFSFGFGEAIRALVFFQGGQRLHTDCIDSAAPSAQGDNNYFAMYVACWRRQVSSILGPFGDRTHQAHGKPWLKLLDPRVVNLNERLHYGLHERAFLYHAFAMDAKEKAEQLNAILGFVPR